MAIKIFKEREKNIRLAKFYMVLLALLALGLIITIAYLTENWLFTLIVFFYALLVVVGNYLYISRLSHYLKGRELTKKNFKDAQILNIVEELKLAAGHKEKVEVWEIPEESLNAFAYTTKDKGVIGIHKGAIEKLNRAEMSALIGHELSHIINRDTDIKVSTFLILVFLGAIADFFISTLRSARGGRSKGVLGAIILGAISLVALIIGKLLFYAISRRREALADVEAVRLTRDKEGMLSLLNKLKQEEQRIKQKIDWKEALTRVTNPKAHLYFWDLSGLLASHPPLEERIKKVKEL
ncbi:MAG: M48 family metalloprotease [Candidatus Micrarchaeota archaeon]|nr:M48 family metalloprotease [Candidatus Micrarchaeota archaeon]